MNNPHTCHSLNPLRLFGVTNLTLLILTLMSIHVANAIDVTSGNFTWSKDFAQTGNSTVSAEAIQHFFFAEVFIPPGSGVAVTTVDLDPSPFGTGPVSAFNSGGGGNWEFETQFAGGAAGEAALLSAFPAGVLYLLTVDRGLPSQASASFNPGPQRWPPSAPALTGTKFDDLQGMNSAMDFVFAWTAAPTVPPDIPAVILGVETTIAEVEKFLSGPHFSMPFATTDTMSGGTLSPGTSRLLFLEYATGIGASFTNVSGNTAGWIFGGVGAPSFSVNTELSFTTAAAAGGVQTVPTLSEWGVIILGGGLALMAYLTVRRMNREHQVTSCPEH